jgi:hypothetical protein
MEDSPTAHKIVRILGTSLICIIVLYNTHKGDSAEIIKIEHPTKGDDTHSWGLPDLTYTDGIEHPFPGESAYYLSVCFRLIAP